MAHTRSICKHPIDTHYTTSQRHILTESTDIPPVKLVTVC
jgi:hypothetical protein